MKLRALMLSVLALASMAYPAHAEDAADYPSRKIKMLLPFAITRKSLDILRRNDADISDDVGRRRSGWVFADRFRPDESARQKRSLTNDQNKKANGKPRE